MSKNLQKVYQKQDILDQLSKLNIPRNRIVIMHSSLRLIGTVEGGAKTLLDAMIEYFTADGGLFCVPTHTWGSLAEAITLDVCNPATCLGAFSDLAAADPRGIRSENPTHSVVIFGDRERVLELVKDELHVASGTAPNSFYGKLYNEGGYVLLVGVSHNKNTYLHCVEELVKAPNRLNPNPRTVVVKRASGEIVCRDDFHAPRVDLIRNISKRFPKYETALRYYGAITDGFIGNAPAQVCDARIMKEAIEVIFNRCGDEDPMFSEEAIPPKWYC